MTRSLFSLIMVLLTLVACAGNNQVPATAVVVPANALPPEELRKSASHIITRGQFKGDRYSEADHPILLRIVLMDPRCLVMSDGSSRQARDVINRSTGSRVAIGFHSGNSTCGRDETYGRVPYVFVEIGYRLPDWWLFVVNDTRGNWVHCWLSHHSSNLEDSWCEDSPKS